MWTCPKCEREIKHPKQWHNCVKVNIDDLFKGKSRELVLLFDRLLSVIIDWNNVSVSATTNCIVFVHHQTFLIIRPMKTQLDLKFYSQLELTQYPVIKSVWYSGRFKNHIRVSALEDVSSIIILHIKIPTIFYSSLIIAAKQISVQVRS